MSGAAAPRAPFAFDPKGGAVFGERDVARCYAFRMPYSPALYRRLLALVSRQGRLLDLGCGPGKIAIQLAPRFDEVIAVDPSQAMLDVAMEQGPPCNIRWLCGRAEDAAVGGAFDAVAIGTAVHWMQHEIVFPRLSQWRGSDGLVAIIDSERNDSEQAWSARWVALLSGWLKRVGRDYDPVGFAAAGRTYERWLDIEGRESFIDDVRQPVEQFIACQHSTATFARARMGAELATEFDAELDAALRPLSDNGALTFKVRSNLTWGIPRTSAKD